LLFVVQLVGDSGSTVVDDSQTVNDEVEFTEVRQQNRVLKVLKYLSCENGYGGHPLCVYERDAGVNHEMLGSVIRRRMIVRPS
jgi:hypothetical protein